MRRKSWRLLVAVLVGVFTSMLIAGPGSTLSGPYGVVTGPGSGGGPDVRKFTNGSDFTDFDNFFPYSVGFGGGVRVATGNINDDSHADIVTGAGPGAGPHVKAFDGDNFAELASFFPYALNFDGGVFVAMGDVNGDNISDIVTGAGEGGGPHVKVYSGHDNFQTQLLSFFAYDLNFNGGVRVAADDIDSDGYDDIITGAGPGGGPHVRAFSGLDLHEIGGFFAYPTNFGGGVYVATGDIFGNGPRDIVTGPGPGTQPEVRIFEVTGTDCCPLSGVSFAPDGTLMAYDSGFRGGVRVAIHEADDSCCESELITGAGPGGGPHVKIFDGDTLVQMDSFFAYDVGFSGGVFVSGITTTL